MARQKKMKKKLTKVAKGSNMQSMDRVKKISVSLPSSVIDAVKARAKADGRSFSNAAATMIREATQEKAASKL